MIARKIAFPPQGVPIVDPASGCATPEFHIHLQRWNGADLASTEIGQALNAAGTQADGQGTLGVVPGEDVAVPDDVTAEISDAIAALSTVYQPKDDDLTALATNGPPGAFGLAWLLHASLAAGKAALSLVKGDVGLGNVDNTADTAKPVSTAQQAALDLKQPIDAELTAIAGLVSAADRGIYFTGSGAAALFALTSVARTLVAQTTQALMRTAGLGFSTFGSNLVVAATTNDMRDVIQAARAGYSTINSDANSTTNWSAGNTGPFIRDITTLTGNRNRRFGSSGSPPMGAYYVITRVGSGAFSLNIIDDVGGTTLKALATNTWCTIVWDGTNWQLAQYGTT